MIGKCKPGFKTMLMACAFVFVLVLVSCSARLDHPDVEPEKLLALRTHLEENARDPYEYIADKLDEHDLVFIGEIHGVRHNLVFIQRLIPFLHQMGIYSLCTEFARREDQGLIDSLLAEEIWDEALAREITFRHNVHWGFQEYVDVFKAAWKSNRSSKDSMRPFRIIGVNDSPDWSFVTRKDDRQSGEIMRKVWQGGGEEFWARIILDEVIARGEKAVVYSGIHHAFTEYLQPICDGDGEFIRFEENRMGNFIYREIGKRAITVFLHGPWRPTRGYGKMEIYPVDGVIDVLITTLGKGVLPAGFDTHGTPFGSLEGETSIYSRGYEEFSLETFCDGYIVFDAFSVFEGMSPIDDFVNGENIDYARKNDSQPRYRKATVDEFKKSMRKRARIGYRHLY
ncbi:MAG: ChaN family lipoprotein [Bacteroidales bacterium]|nr:ChaN family lipoprotein [Candidatus Latescibacterota bacterium]